MENKKTVAEIIKEGRELNVIPTPFAPKMAIMESDVKDILNRIEDAHKRELQAVRKEEHRKIAELQGAVRKLLNVLDDVCAVANSARAASSTLRKARASKDHLFKEKK